jgi:hypothetical protein
MSLLPPAGRLPLALLVACGLAPLALAQPTRDEAGIAALFGRVVAVAHADSTEAAFPLMACPLADDAGGLEAAVCDPGRADHRARVEWQLALVHRLFPETSTALRPNYALEQEGDMWFHLLLFNDLPEAPYALASFTDVDGAARFIEVQVEAVPDDVPPPASVVAAFERLIAAASDEATTVEAFAPLVVASGGDPARDWKVAADPAREAERRAVTALLDSLRSLLEQSVRHEVAGFAIEYEAEGVWHLLETRFSNDVETEHVTFAFLPVGSTLLIGDVDG